MPSFFPIAIILIVTATIVSAYRLGALRSQLDRAIGLLHSMDEELFRLAQEQNPHYGLCSRCGSKSIVRHVVPIGVEPDPSAPEAFYCKACWWLSSTVKLGDEKKYFKDRFTEPDATAARIGPG